MIDSAFSLLNAPTSQREAPSAPRASRRGIAASTPIRRLSHRVLGRELQFAAAEPQLDAVRVLFRPRRDAARTELDTVRLRPEAPIWRAARKQDERVWGLDTAGNTAMNP
jgi:hypothetical protein